MMRSIRRLLGLLALLALSLPGLAAAHSELISSTPKDGAVLDSAPTTISAVFSEEFDMAGSDLTVEDASGQRVDRDDARIDPADGTEKTMLVSLKSGLGAGSYTVRWKTLAADGDTDEGSFSFSVRSAGAAASPAPGSSGAANTTTGGTSSTTTGGTAGTTGDTASTLPATGTGAAPSGWLALLALGLCGGGLLLRRRGARV